MPPSAGSCWEFTSTSSSPTWSLPSLAAEPCLLMAVIKMPLLLGITGLSLPPPIVKPKASATKCKNKRCPLWDWNNCCSCEIFFKILVLFQYKFIIYLNRRCLALKRIGVIMLLINWSLLITNLCIRKLAF